MSEAQVENFDLDSILDMSLDDVEDLPEFVTPPPGHYKLLLKKLEQKTLSEKPALVFSYAVIETLELSNEADTPVAGDLKSEFSETFFLNNEKGLAFAKKNLAPLSAHFGVKTVRELIAACEGGVEVAATIKNRANKEKTAIYPSVSNIIVA